MKKIVLTVLALAIFSTGGCVERFIKVTSTPPGAVVWLNDKEIGTTPVTVPFTWYGQYSVDIRKDGYQPVLTSRKTDTPLFQLPVIDFFTECLLPFNFVDEHQWHYDLTANELTDTNELIIRAERMKIQSQYKAKAKEEEK